MRSSLETSNGARKKIASFLNVLIFCLLLAIFFLFLVNNNLASDKEGLFKTGEILVKFKSNPELVSIKIKPEESFYKILDHYQKLPTVEYAEPDYIYQAAILPSDTYFNNQWYLQKVKATLAWNDVRESPNAVIAILDSGVQIDHPDLRDNIWVNKKEAAGDSNIDDDKNGFIDDINGWDFVNNVADPSPKFQPGFTEDGINHGTIIAGIAAASGNNAAGIAGVAWKARIMPLKVLDDSGEGSSAKVIKAIDYAIANGANIINLSFVGFGYSKSLDEAIKRAYDAGALVTAAGGNEQKQGEGYYLDKTPMYPVCLDGPNGENRVIGVAATDTLDQKATFSSFGKCIDIAAPGVSVFSTVVCSPTNYIKDQPLNKYYDGYWSGTSVAVPIISASLALIETANPSLNRNEILKALFSTADDISRLNPNYAGKLGSGRINLLSAVTEARNILSGKREKLLVAPQGGYQSLIKIFNQDGKIEKEFLAFDKSFKGGVSLASGDVNGDGQAEIIAAAGPGGGPHVKIFNLDGELKNQFFAFKNDFRGGVKVACSDANHDGLEEIIAVQATNGDSEVKIFNGHGQLLGSFYAYDNKFKGGLNIATGDIDGDGEAEIAIGLAAGKIPEVRIFKAIGVLESQFLAYPKTFRGGVRVTIANIKGGTQKNRAQIITAPAGGGGPHVKFFDIKGNLLSHFFAFNSNLRSGVNLAKADADNDGLDEVITGAGPGGAPHVRVFKANNILVGSFYAYEESDSGGVNVGSIRVIK